MFSSLFFILLIQGKRWDCLDERSNEENIFGQEHYGEVGYARDVCVKLGRNLIRTLQLTDATQPCQDLALTRTSTCWPFQGCKKWQRNDSKNEKANEIVLTRALRMVEDFNNHVSQYPVISKITDQKFIWKSVDIAVRRLVTSGAVDANSDLIGAIYKLKSNYCRTYKRVTLREAFQKEDEEDRNEQADEPAKNEDYSQPMDDEYEQTETSNEIEIEFLQDCSDDERETSTTDDEQEELPLHKSVFRDNWSKFTNLLDRGYDVTKKDKHGNTALHLAAMLGRKDYIDLLLKFNAPIRSRNISGWSALDEAISYADEDIVQMMLPTYNKQLSDDLMGKRRQLLSELENMKDFYMEIQWDFHSWLPGISHFLPSDLCKIRKRGSSIRMETTLVGLDLPKFHYIRGDITLLFDGKASPTPTSYFLDNNKKYYMIFDFQPDLRKSEAGIDVQAYLMLESVIPHVTMSRSCITFEPLMAWWRSDKRVGRFNATYYEVKNLKVRYRARTEHLSKQQIKENEARETTVKTMIFDAMKGKMSNQHDSDVSEDEDEVEKVPPCQVTWEQYISSKPGLHPTLARTMIVKEQLIKVKTTVGMSKELPLPIDTFARILEVIAPFKHFDKLREFIQMKLPEGFPVKLEIPIIATVSARITFPEFKYCSESEEDPFPDIQFQIPENYRNVT